MSRSPFVLNVSDLLGRDASPRREVVEASVDWHVAMNRVLEEPPLRADLMLYHVSGGIAVTGSVDFVTEDTCTRCLATSVTDRTVTFAALFDRNDDDDESYPIAGHDIDVEQMLRDEVLLSLPITNTCGPDCPGVVNSTESDLNTGSSGVEGDPRSPFSVLKDLLEPED